MGQIGPKCDQSGTYSDQISVQFGPESVQNSFSKKVQDLFHITYVAHLSNLEPNPTFPIPGYDTKSFICKAVGTFKNSFKR